MPDTITFPDGSRRYATIMTLHKIQKLMDKDVRTGESLGGRYFWCSDLSFIRDVGFSAMAAAIRGLIESGEIEQACGLLALPNDAREQSTP